MSTHCKYFVMKTFHKDHVNLQKVFDFEPTQVILYGVVIKIERRNYVANCNFGKCYGKYGNYRPTKTYLAWL